MLNRRTILLKPMQSSLSGYARLQTDASSTVVQIHARGLEQGQGARAYWYLSGQRAQEIARADANAHGEVSFEAGTDEPADRLRALILLGEAETPKPLLIGLCAPDADLMDVKNAALALCERLSAARRPSVRPVAAPAPPVLKMEADPLPREVFLPALDPSPYAPAISEKAPAQAVPPPRSAPPVDRLRPLKWPRGFETLKPYFEKALPTALFEMPGWRFVYAAHAGGPNGLWIGFHQEDGCVRDVAYAHRGDQPPASPKGYQTVRGLDGQLYQMLRQIV